MVNVSALNTYRGSIAIMYKFPYTTIATAQRHQPISVRPREYVMTLCRPIQIGSSV